MESDIQHEEVSRYNLVFLARSLSNIQDCIEVAEHLESPRCVIEEVEREHRINLAALNMLERSKKYTSHPRNFTYGLVYKAFEGALNQSGSRDLACALIEFEDLVGHTVREREKCNE